MLIFLSFVCGLLSIVSLGYWNLWRARGKEIESMKIITATFCSKPVLTDLQIGNLAQTIATLMQKKVWLN